ncbi:MAG: hypothetical protein HYY85_11910, partial [Deltaproteobacteria bacterium]|nr:hypothetical protein [Deltaproteobacteria bacterium]
MELVKPTSPDCAPERLKPAPEGKARFYICIPDNPEVPEIGPTEWYDYTPRKFRRNHPTLKIRAALGILFWPRPGFPAT